ncbi:MAG: IS701 family transposase [Cupriavidus sp.]|uniref:IS701 family transposase n=1 Tax=Cupriavidus sp. TaxID=1873897 RepID=UPI0025BCA3ED|nr:IS701 family transposase [Cupriavidus sp.]MCA3194025.1 IS701 family transposase [Cupriavidus sp.]
MTPIDELECYLTELTEVLGHADRHAGLKDYCRGLLLPIARKSIEPIAAHLDPERVQAKHQALHHFVAKSPWSDEAVLRKVREIVAPHLALDEACYWIVDETGIPKQGRHSVGVARQYCGQVGKNENCQVAVSLSLASEKGSLPIAFRLYLPEAWANDPERRNKAGVPETVTFATKPEIALSQISEALAAGVPPGVVLADAVYGDTTHFRDQLTAWGLRYAVAVREATTVWPPGVEPLQPEPYSGRGRPAKNLRRSPGHEPVSVKRLAESLPQSAYRTVTWREGSNGVLRSRFAAVRVRAAHRDYWRSTLREPEWLLIEWPETESEPSHYFLCTLPETYSLTQLVHTVKMRWRIERDYRELKQEVGLGHYEGRNWRGFHHHATLTIAAYGFLLLQRLKDHDKKNRALSKAPPLPQGYIPRGSPKSTTPRTRLDRNDSLLDCPTHRPAALEVSLLRENA